jgi:hypothetical protein
MKLWDIWGSGPNGEDKFLSAYQSFQLSILINGSPPREFQVGPNGDPLFSFLFDIVVEGLSVLFQRASMTGLIRGIKLQNGDSISHLQYANDTLVFTPDSLDSMLFVKRILRLPDSLVFTP